MFARITPVVRTLLIINVAAYFLNYLLGDFINQYLSFYSYMSPNFYPFQLLTYMFLHGSLMHLFSNMLGLFVFGPLLEQFWGGKRFLAFYLITGVGAGIIYSGVNYYELNQLKNHAQQYIENPSPGDYYTFLREHLPNYTYDREISRTAQLYAENEENQRLEAQTTTFVSSYTEYTIQKSRMLGASGAIFGILLAFGMLFPNTELFLLFPPIPIKAKYLVTFYGLYTIYAGIQKAPGDNVAHYAHLGGMVVAFILLRMWRNQRNKFY